MSSGLSPEHLPMAYPTAVVQRGRREEASVVEPGGAAADRIALPPRWCWVGEARTALHKDLTGKIAGSTSRWDHLGGPSQ